MFYLSFCQANLYAPIFLCVLDKNANSEHIRSTFAICSEFGALLRFSEQLKTLTQLLMLTWRRLMRKDALSFAKLAAIMQSDLCSFCSFQSKPGEVYSMERSVPFLELSMCWNVWEIWCWVRDGKIFSGPLAWGGADGHGREDHHLGGGVRQ